MSRFSFYAPLALAAAFLAAMPAVAQTPAPSPAPQRTPFAGFSATGTLALQAQYSGSPLSVGAEVAVQSRARRVRIDVLHLAMTGSDANANAMMVQMLPHGTITLVYDQGSSLTTIWSQQKRVYYQSVATSTRPSATPAPNATSPIDQVLSAMQGMTEYDSFSQSFTLAGHQPVNGRTASLYHFTVQSQKHGGKLQDVSGDVALADDLSGIPIRWWVTAKGDFEGTLKLDLIQASATPPSPSVFAVPSGYKRVSDVFSVLANSP